jgi:hypothetical protein
MPQLERFAGGPAATPALIQLRRKAGELSSQYFYNGVIYHGIKVVQAHKIGQLFIYDDNSPRRRRRAVWRDRSRKRCFSAGTTSSS